MSVVDIEQIENILSSKFNRIFYDRVFIYSVLEDLKVLSSNKDECCVVIFPALKPSFLKAIRYLAEVFDLAAFALQSGRLSSIAVCHRKYLIGNVQSWEEQKTDDEIILEGHAKVRKKYPDRQLYIHPTRHVQKCEEQKSSVKIMPESGAKVRNRRPERQLYIPPARRFQGNKNEPLLHNHVQQQNNTIDGRESIEITAREENLDSSSCVKQDKHNLDVIEYTLWCYSYSWWKYCVPDYKSSFFSDSSVMNKYIIFKTFMINILDELYMQVPLYSCNPVRRLEGLKRDIFLWQPTCKITYVKPQSLDRCFEVFSCCTTEFEHVDSTTIERIPVIAVNYDGKVSTKKPKIHDFDLICIRGPLTKSYICSLLGRCFYCIIDDNVTVCSIEDYVNDLCGTNSEINHSNIKGNELDEEKIKCMDSSLSLVPQKSQLEGKVAKRFSVTPDNGFQCSKNIREKEHDEEKEIMRKTKENINRRIKPIMKYVDDTNNMLCICRDDVNNWEELFDEEGQLHDDLVKEIVRNVGKEATIVKAKEDYSDCCTNTKQIEEFEHMVELYDFPASFETKDLIHAFSEINSDAMYVKWVDDTHAILVLGSLAQAQRAISLGNPLIKVRPMTAASKSSLSAAYKHDLKPAMKRPQTNLQTARRLITTHLGRKSVVSVETSAREKDDLRIAREHKRLTKKNERDAWEGNLRSSLN